MTSPSSEDVRAEGKLGGGRWVAPFSLAPEERLGFTAAIEAVKAALCFGIDLTLETTQAILAELGHPEASFAAVQVAGTNGKTSTSRYTAALLRGEGVRCGLYTSPHLVSYVERVEVDGRPVSEEAFAEGISYALAAWARVQAENADMARLGCTEFELLTAAAMVMFARAGVEAAVLEVGLGGRWDATTAVPTVACAVTGIGLDHTKILGDTLEAIAGEKAAIIRPGNPCVLGTNAVRPQGVLDVMLAQCDGAGVTPTAVVERDGASDVPEAALALPRASFAVTHVPRGLGDELHADVSVHVTCAGGEVVRADYPDVAWVAPRYQAQNAACALALATAVLARPLDVRAARASIAACRVPGRFEVVREDPLVLIDACHNPQSCEAFAAAVRDAEPDVDGRPPVMLAALADKDHAGIASIVAPLFGDIVVTQSSSPRALPADDLAAEVRAACGPRARVRVTHSVAEALALLEAGPFVCCGTITLIGELKGMLLAAGE